MPNTPSLPSVHTSKVFADRAPPTKSIASKSRLEKVATNIDADLFLKSLKEFQDLPPSELKALAVSCRFAKFDSGEYITTEGDDESSNGFIVVSGCLAMLKTSLNGKELVVELLQAGDIFGTLLPLASEKLPAQLSARCMQNSEVLWVPTNSFFQVLKDRPQILPKIISHLLHSLHSSFELSRGLAHDKVEVRIATVLSILALKFFKTSPGEKIATLRFTRQQIADLTGSTVETAIRVTRAMQHQGLIDIQRPGMIRVLNLDALRDVVAGD